MNINGRQVGRKRVNPIPVEGQEIGDYTVLVLGVKKCTCRCRCGKVREVFTNNLNRGRSNRCRSCGIKYGMERKRAGMVSEHKVTNAAMHAIRRCTDENDERYADYGGRGIAVHPPWVEDRSLFAEYLCTLPGFDDPDSVLDRIENDKGYEPGNLRWVDVNTSNLNRRPFGEKES